MKDDQKTTISANKQKKATLVAQISEKVVKAKAMIATNYQGMTHKQLEELKKALKNTDAELVVTKNTLLNRSLEENKIDPFKDLNGPTATLFAYSDPIEPLKALAKTIKLLNLPEIKIGILDGKLISASDIIRLSSLPSREVLLTQLVGTLNSPITGLVKSLNWNIQKFVLTLNAVQQKKSTS